MKKQNSGTAGPAREDRLKAALKANLARRKAQARARSDPMDTAEPEPTRSAAPGPAPRKENGDG
jgi:hypothetical protein